MNTEGKEGYQSQADHWQNLVFMGKKITVLSPREPVTKVT